MFSESEKNSVKSPMKTCNSYKTSTEVYNLCNLSCLHKHALLIHPQWMNGLNATLKKSIVFDENFYHDFDGNVTRLNRVQFEINYSPNIKSNFIFEMPTISKLFICYHPLASLRMRIQNQTIIPSIFYPPRFYEKLLSSSISTRNVLNVDWFGRFTQISSSTLFSNCQPISTSLSLLARTTSNFEFGVKLNCSRNNEKIKLQPCLAAGYSNQNTTLAGTIKSSKINCFYFHRLNRNFTVGSIFNFNLPEKNGISTAVCQYEITRNALIRAKIASTGLIGGIFELKIWHFNITNSILANFSTHKIIYGMKIGIEL